MEPRIERRTRRSEDHGEALTLFLASQRSALKARGLLVTTSDGHVLASAGPPTHSRRVGIWQLRAGDKSVIIASDGGHLSHELGAGVKRILGG